MESWTTTHDPFVQRSRWILNCRIFMESWHSAQNIPFFRRKSERAQSYVDDMLYFHPAVDPVAHYTPLAHRPHGRLWSRICHAGLPT